jgi:hypothetical protein
MSSYLPGLCQLAVEVRRYEDITHHVAVVPGPPTIAAVAVHRPTAQSRFRAREVSLILWIVTMPRVRTR